MAEKIFAKGIYFSQRVGAPVYVKGSLSIKVSEAISFLEQHVNGSGYVNIDVKESKGGKLYCELNTYVAKSKTPRNEVEDNQAKLNDMDTIEYPEEDINPDEIPF